jgi:hypothetical protein
MSNPYVYVEQQAILTDADVDAQWKATAPKGVYYLNRCFELYYNAYSEVTANGTDKRDARWRSLWQAANSGDWITGMGRVDRLTKAFDHLAQNDGRWKDENTWNYNGGPGRFGGNVNALVPLCAANFMEAVNKTYEKLRDALDGFSDGLGKLKEGNEAEDATKWKKLGEGLEAVEKYGRHAKPLLWVAPKTLSECGERLLKWDERILKLHQYGTRLMDVAASNQPGTEGLFQALELVVSYAPMIGGFYGKIVAEIPDMARNWTQFMDVYWAKRGTTRYSKSAGW